MRVGVVTTSYPRFAGDAAGHFVRSHVEWMSEAGHLVEVVCAAGAPTLWPEPDDRAARVDRVPVGTGLFYEGGAPDRLDRSPRSWASAGVFAARLTAAVYRRSAGWDAIVAHWWLPSAMAAVAASRRAGHVPLLAIAHSGDIHLARRLGVLRPVVQTLLRQRAKLVFVNQALAELAAAAIDASARPAFWQASLVSPMGVTVATRAATGPLVAGTSTDAPVSALDSRPSVLFLGRLVPIKGIDTALAAARLAKIPWRLTVAGGGPLATEVRASAEATPERVHWLGEVSTTARNTLLSAARCLVVPSRVLGGGRGEGLPLAALEALAARVPLIVTTSGGLAELPDSVCVRVPTEDPAALAAAIDAVISGADPGVGTRVESGASWVADKGWAAIGRRLWEHADFESASQFLK